MAIQTDIKEFKLLVDLVHQFEESDEVIPAEEFLKNKMFSGCPVAEMTAAKFLLICRYQMVINKVSASIMDSEKILPSFKKVIKVLLFGIIFYFEMSSYSEVMKCFEHLGLKKSLKVLKYFTNEEKLVKLIEIFCSVYCTDFVLDILLKPIVNKMQMLQMLEADVDECIKTRETVPRKQPTIPKGPCFVSRTRFIPKPPANSLENSKITLSRPVPKSVYCPSKKIESGLKQAHDNNRKKAFALLKKAQTEKFKCATEKSTPPLSSPIETFTFKANNAPAKKHIVVRSTAASLMREAATFAKEEEKNLKVLENVVSGAYDPTTLIQMEEEMKRLVEQENNRMIEKKHLEGLLTYEEAILAKKKLAKDNEEKVQKMKEEQAKLLEEINAWREVEEEKMRIIVEKIKAIERNAREAEKKVLNEKQKNAKLQDFETKKLLQESLERQKEELARKVNLIQELRAMHQIRDLEPKEFDPTECPNFGLLCEMSIAELKERLGLLKLEVKEELETKRDTINKNKQRQQTMLENAKNFISQTRMSKPKPLPSTPPKLEQTPDLVALRERLERARSMRMGTS